MKHFVVEKFPLKLIPLIVSFAYFEHKNGIVTYIYLLSSIMHETWNFTDARVLSMIFTFSTRQ